MGCTNVLSHPLTYCYPIVIGFYNYCLIKNLHCSKIHFIRPPLLTLGKNRKKRRGNPDVTRILAPQSQDSSDVLRVKIQVRVTAG
jgi:hypothetical protein